MKTTDKIKKLNSVLLCLRAHPDNEPDSEFEDRISDIEEIIQHEKDKNYSMTWPVRFVKSKITAKF